MKRIIVLLGVVGVSFSAIFVRWSTAPSMIIALYRMVFAALLLAPAAVVRREELMRIERRELALSLTSGVFLGCHFAAYFESLHRTSIASAVVLVDMEALLVALASVVLFRKKMGKTAWLAVFLAFGGSVIVAMADSAAGALDGDLIALLGALCVAVYTMLGAVCRKKLSTLIYTFLVYLAASGMLTVIACVTRTPLTGYGPENLLAGLGLAVFCTLLGHSVFSWGLKFLSPAFISTAKLLEPVFASVGGLILFQEQPSPLVVLGGLLVLAGVALYIRVEDGE